MLQKRVWLVLVFLISALSLFSVTEPLWLRYPSISPDGSEVVFNYKGDIFKVSVNGGEAVQLTSSASYDFRAIWSPDGKTIVFASDRHGNLDLFSVPSKGGTPSRITFHSANEYPETFTKDGKSIIFTANRQDSSKSALFPRGHFAELYKVPVSGGRVEQVLTTPAFEADLSDDGKRIVYQDRRGIEDVWRKHHTSSTTRNIWIYDTVTKKHKKITEFKGEDLYPVFADNSKAVYYLSEKSGSANVFRKDLDTGKIRQITSFKNHPLRFLSVSNDNTLCFSYNGQIYLKKKSGESSKLKVSIIRDSQNIPEEYKVLRRGVTEMAVSPNSKEIAFIIRGDVYVTSTDYSTTRAITNTPEQERSVSFSPDGKTLVYAGERNNSWNIYTAKIVNPKEKYFTSSTLIKEKLLLNNGKETFQPKFSPDGKEVAFLEERTELRVINLKTMKVRTVLSKDYNFSYGDGDIVFNWSPDSKYFLINYLGTKRWNSDIGMVAASGKEKIVNLTQSGYSDADPKWVMNGRAMLWLSDSKGMRSHGSWGSQNDAYVMFFSQKAFDRFKMSKEEFELLTEREKDEAKAKKKREKKSKKKVKKVKTPFIPDLKGIKYRKMRLTVNSSSMSDAVLSPDGEKLYYLARFEKGFDLWVLNVRKRTPRLLKKLSGWGHSLTIDKKGKNLFLMSGSRIMKISASGKPKTVSFNAEMYLNKEKERAYLFEHVWRQVLKKFYDPKMQGVDWAFYKKEYKKMLPHINNNYDFAEMLSEMLGELNASHTGCRYYKSRGNGDSTASLGIFIDYNYKGKGIKIAEIMDRSPLNKSASYTKPGTVIEKIDSKEIKVNEDYYKFLNHKTSKSILLSLLNPKTKRRWTEIVKPVSARFESEMLYQRWVKQRREETERLSGGRIGYVHVRAMNDASFRAVYEDMFGSQNNKEAIIVDTRFNGGGSLHEDLAKLLSGKAFFRVMPREQYIGTGPRNQWFKPSAVLMGEANYSNAHGFPYVYKLLKLGKLIGQPVPGTMTSVWWERLQDRSLVFGIPIVGRKDEQGRYLENLQLEPDVYVQNDFEALAKGKDQQIKKAVELLLKEVDEKKAK